MEKNKNNQSRHEAIYNPPNVVPCSETRDGLCLNEELKMRWFKHYSDSIDNPKIQEILDRFGHSGYFFYFGIIEFLAREDALDSPADTTLAYLCRKLRTRPRQLLDFLRTSDHLLSHNFSEETGRVSLFCKKMQELKDNYTKDLQGSCKKLASKEIEKDIDKEKDIDIVNVVTVWCDSYKSKFGINPDITKADAGMLQRYKKTEDIKKVFDIFFGRTNWAKDYTVPIFIKEYNKIRRELTTNQSKGEDAWK